MSRTPSSAILNKHPDLGARTLTAQFRISYCRIRLRIPAQLMEFKVKIEEQKFFVDTMIIIIIIPTQTFTRFSFVRVRESSVNY